ncbi:hypothetical protein [Streptomyces sp. SID13031]|uniref:hypothetical protein n=1 Tax=Streptomyces sp. SID13031 TaxID=2706046 RepID=UPI0019436F10|nr:hypothetical protein [Streptomyces sp. SID13031]
MGDGPRRRTGGDQDDRLRPTGVQLRRTALAPTAADQLARNSSYPGIEEWLDAYLRSNYSDTEALEAFRPRSEV